MECVRTNADEIALTVKVKALVKDLNSEPKQYSFSITKSNPLLLQISGLNEKERNDKILDFLKKNEHISDLDFSTLKIEEPGIANPVNVKDIAGPRTLN
jgi:hypothetical protein